MKPVDLSFLWHMHQPMYKDPFTGVYTLPWVRLHGVKGYYDMITALEAFPTLRATFNLTPSLLVQILEYASGGVKDLFLQRTEKPARDLSPEEREFLILKFFLCHKETMIRPYPRYWELMKKRGKRVRQEEMRSLLRGFSTQDFLDLQVWFNLAWFGFAARSRFPRIGELIAKGKGFTEEEKGEVISAQFEILSDVIPAYRRAADRGQIEISTSPFYHPILPLLCDTDLALRPKPMAVLPPRFHHPEDARLQVREAAVLHERIFSRRPVGLWPSEGAVAPEIVPILQEAGFSYFVADEEILHRSLEKGDAASPYQPYLAAYGDRQIAVLFRDKNLSNLIGFTYGKVEPIQAVTDFFATLDKQIGSADSPAVVVTLDGENPWEYYPESGSLFIKRLYERLSKDEGLSTVTCSALLAAHPPQKVLDHLATGSWIDGNFDIWIGHPEDNLGWSYLKKTRDFLKRHLVEYPETDPKIAREAWEQIYIAEGSDWFWWYGDQFTTDTAAEFDRLFRSRLIRVFDLLGAEAPQYLKQPVIAQPTAPLEREPSRFISPVMDGKITHFFEWEGAGFYQPLKDAGRKYKGEGSLSAIRFGFDSQQLYFRLDPAKALGEGRKELTIHVHLLSARRASESPAERDPLPSVEYKLVFPLAPEPGEGSFVLHESRDGIHFSPLREYSTIASSKLVELSIPFFDLCFSPEERIRFVVEVKRDTLEVDRYPMEGYFTFRVPAPDFETAMWSVL